MSTNTPPTSDTIRAGCYLRISSDPKDKRQGVDRQRQDTTVLCEKENWTPVAFYEDNDRSASNGKERPEWERLLADVKAGKIDAIAAWDQDRGWRLMHELEDLRRFFSSLGREIKLATTGQGEIDLYSPTGVMTAQIKTAVSEHEISMMKVRMRRAARQKAERGAPQWKRAFGYATDGSRQLDSKTAPLVKLGYTSILTGASLGDICRIWNGAEAYGLKGQPWSASTVSLFLRKPRNAGLRYHNGLFVCQGDWPALVAEPLWRSVQAVLDDPRRKPGRKSVQKHLLTGVLFCGRCEDQWLSGHVNIHGATVYVCKHCRGVAIKAADVEPLMFQIVAERLSRSDAVDLLKAEIDPAEAEAIRTELNTLYGDRELIGVERGQRLLTGQQAFVATALINDDIAKLERKQQDAERLAVFEGLPLGKPEVAGKLRRLSPDRYRAVVAVLMKPTVAHVGRGAHNRVFNKKRLHPNWN
jgi:DNA invertase Pin-like site-specific DNA recombinase